jgi:type IV pilus assembly protein PilQ
MLHRGLKWHIGLLAYALVMMVCARAAAIAGTVEITKAGSPFSMEFRDADIRDVLRAVGQAADMNLIVSDTVSGQVSLSLKDVDIWDAMEAILKTKGLTYVRDANMVRVVAVSEARDNDMETRVFPLGNASSQDVLPVVEKIKSERAKISVDSRMNAIVVKDLSLNLDQMARLLANLDVHLPQVLIEAKIVEVSRNYARELGVQWGGQHTGTSGQGTTVVTGGTTGGSTAGGAASSVPAVGGTTFFPQTGDIGRSGGAFVVNLPAAVGPGSGGALGISFGKLGGKLSLDLQLSAMQTTGNGKILSSPKVLTVNNKEAKISSGTDIPVRIVSSTAVGGAGSTTTAGVQTISATLALSAIPTIMSDNRIAMVLKVDKSEPDFSRTVDGIPTVTRRSADTHLVVNDGETVVLGGIITKSESQTESGVPLLSDIPVIGWLFKKKTKQELETELMIFITPTVMKD